jgi:hypothetical protein
MFFSLNKLFPGFDLFLFFLLGDEVPVAPGLFLLI